MLRVQLVGRMKVDLDGLTVARPVSRRAWAILAWLVLNPGQQSRARLAATFWPGVPEISARGSLRSAIWSLRQLLGPNSDQYLEVGRERIGLRADAPLWVDVRVLDDCVQQGRLEAALGLGCGVLLEDFCDEWVWLARDTHMAKIAALLEAMACRAHAAEDGAAAVVWTRRQVELEPYSDIAVQRLMRRFAAAGDPAAALRAFDRFCSRLASEFKTTPAVQTRQLANELRSRFAGERCGPALAVGWPLIGRGGELERLLAAWHGTVPGRLSVATISGEPGIGKTRLATELLGRARREGGLVAAAAALDLGAAAPFGVWTELIGGLASTLGGVPDDAAWRQVLAPFVPTPGAGHGPRRPAVAAVPAELSRARLYEATVGMLEWASHKGPVVLLLDDVPLADSASLDLTGYVCRRLADASIFIVLVRRPLPHRIQADALEHALRTGQMLRTEIVLGPLEADDIAALVRGVADLPARERQWVIDCSDGNALLAVESATALARGVPWPPESLRAAVRMALVRLHGDALELSRFLAVVGRDLDRDEIADLTLSDAAVDEIAECALMVAENGCIGFRHALLRDAACADLSDPVRRRIQSQLDQLRAHPMRSE